MGPDAYVSPDWYASPGQVPTWLYQSVQLSGPVRPLPPSSLSQHLDLLGERFETGLAPKPPWRSVRVAPARRKALMKAIQGIEMRVDVVNGSFKLNQHKSDADHTAVAANLMQQTDAHSIAIAGAMLAKRPHLCDGPQRQWLDEVQGRIAR
jgi:transcriptional regulator